MPSTMLNSGQTIVLVTPIFDRQRGPRSFRFSMVASKPIPAQFSEVATQHGAPVISGDAQRCPNYQPPCYPAAYIACAAGRDFSRRRVAIVVAVMIETSSVRAASTTSVPDSRSYAVAYRW